MAHFLPALLTPRVVSMCGRGWGACGQRAGVSLESRLPPQLPKTPDSRAALIESLRRYAWTPVSRRVFDKRKELCLFCRGVCFITCVSFIKSWLKISRLRF